MLSSSTLSGLLRRWGPEARMKVTALQDRASVGSEGECNRKKNGHRELEPGLQIPGDAGLVNHGCREDYADQYRTQTHQLHESAMRALRREPPRPSPARPPCKQQGGESKPPEDESNAYRAQGNADLPASKYRIEEEKAADHGGEDHGCRRRVGVVGAG